MATAIPMVLAPVFFVIAVGYVAGRLRIVDNRQVDGLNGLVMDFALPASLFTATASASRGQMLAQVPFLALVSAVMLLVYGAWYFAVRGVLKSSRADASLQALTIAFPNLAGVGLPVTAAVLGPAGAVPVAVALAIGSIIITPLTLILVGTNGRRASRAGETSPSRRVRALGGAFLKPVVVAPALGILWSLLGLNIGAVAGASLTLIGRAAAGVALYLTGLILSAQPFEFDWKIIGATGMADVLRPLAMAAAVSVVPVSTDTAKMAVLVSAIPAGFFGILFAINEHLDSATIGSMVLASTAFSLVTMAIAIIVLFPH